jgi:hypothetical protein
MSFHHNRRYLDHFEPIISTHTDSNGKRRHKKVSASAQRLLDIISTKLNDRTGEYWISYKYFHIKTAFTKQTIQIGLEQLVEIGWIARERSSNRTAFNYRMAYLCPDDCKDLKDHNTPKELAERPSNQDTQKLDQEPQEFERPSNQEAERPSNQDNSVLTNRSLIDKDKQVNKKKLGKSACSECKGIAEEISGDLQLIHRRGTCKQLIRTMNSDTWAYAVDNYQGNWDALSLEDQQRELHRDRASGEAKRAAKFLAAQGVDQELLDRFNMACPEGLLPNSKKWLLIKYDKLTGIHEQALRLVQEKNAFGLDLLPGRSWEKNAYPQPEDWGETNAALANA